MHIIQDKKLVFIHNPKTGGRSVIKTLKFNDTYPLHFVHLTPKDIIDRFFQNHWNQYVSFCFVRNPWERYVSLYLFHRSIDYATLLGGGYSHSLARNYNFDEWIHFCSKSPKKPNWFGRPQCNWSNGVSRVYQFEKLNDTLLELCEEFGTPYTNCHENHSESYNFRDFYTSQYSIDLVAKIDDAIIKKYHYDI